MNINSFTKEYLSIINSDYKGLNLTRITDPSEFEVKQLEDSIVPFKDFKECSAILESVDIVYDLGFGGGFPILPLSIMYPDKKFIGVEARLKKVKAVNAIAIKLGMKNVECFHGRYEEFSYSTNSLILTKAMATSSSVLKNLISVNSNHICFYKGPAFYKQELVKVTNLEKYWKIFFKKDYKLTDESERTFVVFKKCST